MTTRRLPWLGLLIASLVSSGGLAQSQIPGYPQPSSRQSAMAQAAPASASSQPAATERSNWLKRLVIGESENEEAKPPSVTFSSPSSRQPATSHGAATAPKTGSQAPKVQVPNIKQSSSASVSQSATTNEKGNWFQRLALGDRDAAPAKTDAPKSVVFAPGSRRLPPVESQTTIAAAPTTASKPAGLPPATQPAPQPENRNWFKRLVVGDAKDNNTSTKTVQFAAPQPSSRQGVPAQSPTPSAPTAAQSAALKVTTAPKQAPQQATEERPGWLRRLVVGETPKAPNTTAAVPSSTITNQAHPAQSIASQSTKPRQLSGLFPPPQAQATASQPNSLAAQTPTGQTPTAQTPAAHVPGNLPGSQTGAVVIADSLNEARQSAQKENIDPDSDGSVSLTNWISRRHRQPTTIETAAPRTNALAPAAVDDRSAVAGSRPPVASQQPKAQAVAHGAGSGNPRTIGAGSGDPRTTAFGDPRTIGAGNYNQAALAKTPNSAQTSPLGGWAATNRSATSDNDNTLTGWLTRPFRSGDHANDELLATQHAAAGQSGTKAPVRLPAVTQPATLPTPNSYARLEPPSAPASAASVGLYAERGTTADTASPVPFGNNVRLSAADTSYPAVAAGSTTSATSGATNAYTSHDTTNRVVPANGYQAAPYQSGSAPMMMPPRSLPPIYDNPTALPLVEETYEPPTTNESATNPLGRPKIIFNPVAGMNGRGRATVKPTVQVSHDDEPRGRYPTHPSYRTYSTYPSYPPMRFEQVAQDDSLPPPDPSAIQEGPDVVVSPEGAEGPVVTGEELPMHGAPDMWVPEDTTYEGPMTAHEAAGPFLECAFTVLAHLNGPRSCPPGIGVENVMNAPFWIDTTQPINNCRIRGDGAVDWEFPDRIEYFWSKTPGPKGAQAEFDAFGGEPNVDYQEVSFYIERGTDRFSVGTDLPIRAVDPVVRRNTTGFGDMRVTTKTVLLDGKDWQLTQVFHTHIPTGSFRRGTGNGHVSLEPGVAWRYKWSDVTYIHGDLTYWFPIAADPFHSGQMFNYGIGISHIWIDTDKWAIMPTLELNAWTLLDGRQTFPFEFDDPLDPRGEIDTLTVLNIHPGLRWVCDTAGDCGVREFGISSGIAVTEDHWYEEILRLELRWVF